MLEIAKKAGSKAIIQNASGGQVAALLRDLAVIEGISVIDIARKPEVADRLNQEGAFALCEQDTDFREKLSQVARENDATTAFDAVGGKLSGEMFNALPGDAEMVVYGGLSGKRIEHINEMDLIFKNKHISGFNLIDWKNELGEGKFERISHELQDLFIQGKLKTAFQGVTPLSDIKKGLKAYIGDMSGGKLLIKP
jgi:NADPH:quinone reductase-like Zn-dependent oxidoreductase